METIQYLLTNLLKAIAVIVIVVIIIMAVGKFLPNLSDKFNVFGNGSFFTDDWLPAPVNLQEASKGTVADLTANQYEGMLSPGTSYVIYTDSGMKIVNVPPKKSFDAGNSGYTDTSLFVRNLSIRQGESVSTGSIISGEVKTTFFFNGKFPVYIVDSFGRAYTIEAASSNGQGTFPGWTRFTFQIRGFLPKRTECQLLFVPDPASPDARTTNRAVFPVSCN
jgi:hypothetical protein